jgi:streptogramin lyase
MTSSVRAALSVILALAASGAAEAQAVRLRPVLSVYADGAGGGLLHPEGAAVRGGTLLAVTEPDRGRILLYNLSLPNASALRILTVPQAPAPTVVRFDPRGELLILDARSRGIARITEEGAFRGFVEFREGGRTARVFPRSFALDPGGNLYVLDAAASSVLVAAPGGAVQRRIPYPEGPAFLADLVVDALGTIYVVDSVGKRVWNARRGDETFTPLSEPLGAYLAFPAALAMDDQGRLFLADKDEGGIVILGMDGGFRGRQSAMGWRDGFLRYPVALATDGGSHLVVVERENRRVQVFAISQ